MLGKNKTEEAYVAGIFSAMLQSSSG
eukprot:SAG25_NODE_4085_length_893_cov_1.408060_1_plen_25_part_10